MKVVNSTPERSAQLEEDKEEETPVEERDNHLMRQTID
jgi:hypothetical protein